MIQVAKFIRLQLLTYTGVSSDDGNKSESASSIEVLTTSTSLVACGTDSPSTSFCPMASVSVVALGGFSVDGVKGSLD